MKKILILLGLAITLTSCGEDTEEVEETIQEESSTEVSENEESKEESSEETAQESNVIEVSDYIYVINDWEIVPSLYDENRKVLSLDVTFTNNSDRAISPWMSQGFKAEQETDTTVEVLMGDQVPEGYKPEKNEMEDTDVKPGATVEALLSFELLDENSPVYLRDFFTDETFMEIDITE